MVIVNVYQKCLRVNYKTKLFSKATLFALAILAVSVVLPYIVSYKSRGFWLKHDSFYEQPQVQFKGEYIFVAVTTNVSAPIVCTNFPYMYKASEKFDTCSIIKAKEVDDDKDGKSEEFLFSFNAELLNNEMVQYFTLFFTIDYRLMTTCALHMQSAVLIQQTVPAFVSDLSINAELTISQKAPLQCHRIGIDTHLNHSVVEEEDDVEKYKIGNILQNYLTRDLTTHASNLYASFNTGKESEFAVSLQLRYPEHLLYYKPSFWQMLKWAWIQYFVLYIVVAWIAEKLKQYVYNNRLLLCYEEFPFKEKAC